MKRKLFLTVRPKMFQIYQNKYVILYLQIYWSLGILAWFLKWATKG